MMKANELQYDFESDCNDWVAEDNRLLKEAREQIIKNDNINNQNNGGLHEKITFLNKIKE